PADGRCDLEHRLHQLRVDPRLELAVVGHPSEHRVDVLHEVTRLRVEEHVLLLDAERVRVARSEAVLEDARLVGRLHGRSLTITASASISTSQRGSMSPVTSAVIAGRATPNASRWARPTASTSSACLRKMR